MPITLCWLVIIWITFYMIKYTNIKNLYCISGGFVLSMAGSAITNLVVGAEYPKEISGLNWIGIICCGVLALIFYVAGVMQSKDKI